MENRLKSFVLILAGMALLTFSGCGGSGGTPPITTYTIGGTVLGLSVTGLVLQDNGGDNLPVSADGPFVFNTFIPSGGVYAVTVLTQPSSLAQSCVVTNGSGIATADVTTVQVTCTTNPTGQNEWTWVSGSSTFEQPGVYGTQGVPSPGNTPGARVFPCSWTDGSGNLWLFGGYATETYVGEGDRNDLWKFTPATDEWTWVGGSNTFEQPGMYGALGVGAPGNVPGARSGGIVCWTDAFGNFWLYGGLGLDSTGTRGDLNDLWKYSPAAAIWTWMGGPSTVCNIQGASACPGVYGTQGVPAAASTPGSRSGAVSWADASGNLWLFGGDGWDSKGAPGGLNDLWKYSAGEWTWMGGSNIADNNDTQQFGVYGTLGAAAPGNVPGARFGSVGWTDRAGSLWLFGGDGEDSNGKLCQQGEGALACNLNDLWKYDPTTNLWAWMGGSDVIAQQGVYGTQGEAAPGNVPGARWLAVGWTDAAGNFWLFGGSGFDALGTGAGNADLNDLWKYSGGEWTWVSGSDTANQFGSYGTLGTASPGSVPGARECAVGWFDGSGNLWLFGGFLHWVAPEGKFNDLWGYQP